MTQALLEPRVDKMYVPYADWLLLPMPMLTVPDSEVSRNSVAQFAYNDGSRVYLRGMIRHPEHKTLYLRGWHQVFTQARKPLATMD